MIKSIDKSSVHRITSGQVLVDLQTAVKELVENSLDAGATSLEVRFSNYGLKSFEVIDNGSGISPDDYDNVALKHCTSKISSFEDLSIVQTFGFRGEALSSLCALSECVTITTATSKDAPMGTVLEFDRTGRLTSKTGKAARQRGTSVLVKGFFAPLAVRRKELERNSKREFGKALNLLNAYALVPCTKENKGVRLSVVHIQDGGRKSVQLRTDGKPSLKASISSLWGPKQFESLTELNLTLNVVPERSVLRRRAAESPDSSSTIVRVRGLVSKFSFGSGRAGPDRQYFYINGRPCNPAKIQKAFNEVYRSFNTNQSPFIIADFILPTDSCDINVSPDKRTILLHSENALVAALKDALETEYASTRSTFAVQASATKRDLPKSVHPIATQVHEDEIAQVLENEIAKVDDSVIEESGEAPCANVTSKEPNAGTKPAEIDADEASEPISAGLPLNLTSQHMRPESSSSIFPRTISRSSDLISATDRVSGSSSNGSSSPVTVSPRPGGQSSKPVQMVLSTANASWAIRPASEEPAIKKRKVEQKKSRAVLRTRLASFAAPGSQVISGQVDEESSEDVEDEDEDELEDEDGPSDELAVSEEREGQDAIRQVKPQGDLRESESTENRSSGRDSSVPSILESANVDVPLFLPDTDQESRGKELSKNIDVQIKIEDDDVVMATTNENSTFDAERAEHLRSLDQNPSAVDMEPESAASSSGRTVRTEILKTISEELDVTMQIEAEKIEDTWNAVLRKRNAALPALAPPSVKGKEKEKVDTSAGISNTSDEAGAEQALSRLLDKKDFASMEILGQFNLGFIIARLRQRNSELDQQGGQVSVDDPASTNEQSTDDLFIIDQHASDEKFNFETLQQTTKIASQRLFKSRPLELTAADELIAIENIDILKANGFEIEYDEDAEPSQGRVKLVAQPVSGSTTFDMKDLEELLHLMSDRPAGAGMVRCSKARAMFAMRACRKSVMIGMALNKSQMTSVVRHMGTIDQPWNCPHGRPTMRHLVSLDTTLGNGKNMTREVDWLNL